jgi:peptidoglycan-associated lipoprotein
MLDEPGMNRSLTYSLATVSLLVAGCASTPKPPPSNASAESRVGVTTQTPATARQDVATPTSGSVHIEDRILRACGDIPTAHFAFDSSRIDGEADASLGALARCFTSGPLAGQEMRLIGRADPRGETEYNLALGQRRAGAVATFEEKHGVKTSQIETTSRGAFDASGTDEEGWARDRRVDVLLAH